MDGEADASHCSDLLPLFAGGDEMAGLPSARKDKVVFATCGTLAEDFVYGVRLCVGNCYRMYAIFRHDLVLWV